MKRIKILIITAFLFVFSLQDQERDSLSVRYCKTSQLIGIALPAAMIGYGVLSFGNGAIRQLDYSTRNELLEDNSMWYKRWDDYMQFSPVVVAFGMKAGGMKSAHKMSGMLILYALSNLLESGIAYSAKRLISLERPDGSDRFSFPSGHVATAFVAAEFLHREYGDKSVWISIGGYSMATLIGVARVYNNKHWVSDVVAGASIGILSTKIVYWTYPYLQKTFCNKDKRVQALILPEYNNGNLNLTFSCTF